MEKLVQNHILDHLSSGSDPVYATVGETSSEVEAFIPYRSTLPVKYD